MARDPVQPDRRAAGSVGALLQEAAKHCESGRYERADDILRRIVEQHPKAGAAWYLRGIAADRAGDAQGALACFVRAVACDTANAAYCAALAEQLCRLGRDAEAVEPWRRALDLEPGNAAWHAGMARCLSRLGQCAAAFPHFEAALAKRPDDAALHAAYGYALQQDGRAADAGAQYRAALAIDPDLRPVRLNLAAALTAAGDDEAALEQCREALRQDPRSVPALNALGAALCRLGRAREAIGRLRTVLGIEPENLATLHNLGVALEAAGATAEAEACLRKALALQPDSPDVHRSLGNLLRGSQRLAEAALHYRAVVERLPLDFRSYGNLGLVLLNLNRPHDAIAVYEKALALDSNQADIRMSLGIAQLAAGDFANGWKNYDARWHGDRAPAWRSGHGLPLWRSGNYRTLASEARPSILVHAEQGFGDTIQFSRYLPLVAATGARVLFECQKPLAGLMTTLMPRIGDIRIIDPGAPVPQADCHVPLLSLPGIFGATIETIPARVPYLAAPPDRAERWARHPFAEGLKVGLAWAGNPERQDDRMRSCPPDALSPLLRDGRAVFYALGKTATGPLPSGVVDLGPELSDFGDTAAVMERMDLVISVDTASAHLAGALGRPVWVMLGYAADWRYLLEREDSPWYPTMRLFRQTAPGDWLSVTRRIAEELRRYRPR